ncbi:hypothetical protein NCCP133_03100 [Cytobacillus sp. NCCP-133]|nr:hypothetical protein NCCP133_03100 [Cytobacillus sp. NCCP-133]
MAELLLSLSAWLIVAGVFFPLILGAIMHSLEIKQDFESTQLLYETLQQSVVSEPISTAKNVEINKSEYQLIIKEGSGMTEVCVRYEDVLHKAKEKCDVLQ